MIISIKEVAKTKVHVDKISLKTKTRLEIVDLTTEVSKVVRESSIKNGLVNVWTAHTTAAVAVNEHDEDLWEDILETMIKNYLVSLSFSHMRILNIGWVSPTLEMLLGMRHLPMKNCLMCFMKYISWKKLWRNHIFTSCYVV